MTTYYVSQDPSASDSNSGTSIGNEWKTTSKVRAAFAAGTFQRGDSILFERGYTWIINSTSDQVRIQNIGGSSGYLTIGAYGSGNRPKFNCSVVAGMPGFYIPNGSTNPNWFILEYLEIYNGGSALVSLHGCSNFAIHDCYIHDTSDVSAGSECGLFISRDATNFEIYDNEFDDLNGEGIYCGTWDDDTDHTGYAKIYDNTISNCGAEGVDLKAGTRNIAILYNTITTCDINGGHGSAIRAGGQGHRISRNTITGTGSGPSGPPPGVNKDGITIYYGNGAEDPSNIVIEDNIINQVFSGNEGFAIRLQYCNNIRIWRNTINDSDNGITIQANSTSIVLRNNKLDGCDIGLRVLSGVAIPDSDYNYFVGCNVQCSLEGRGGYQTIATACANYGIECNSATSYPTSTGVYDDDANLQGWWVLDEASGNRADSSGKSNTLTDNNTVGYEDNARIGDAADFELDNDEYLSIADGSQTGLDVTGNLTMMCRIVPESMGDTAVLMAKYNTGTEDRSYMLRFLSNGQLQAWLSNNGTAVVTAYTQQTAVGIDVQYWLTVVYNGSNIRIYVNGYLLENGANNPLGYVDGIYDSAAPFQLGAREGATYPYDGVMNQAMVFNRALNQAEILGIIANGIQAAAAAAVVTVTVTVVSTITVTVYP